jgi:hypothetical protein
MLLSGGVDSSVALHLLLQQNYNVTAFYLRIWLEDELAHLGECPWEDDLEVCQSVCEHAGNVPLQTISLGKEYRDRVVQYTIDEARRGWTPNPDIMCNSQVKFGCFLDYIEKSTSMITTLCPDATDQKAAIPCTRSNQRSILFPVCSNSKPVIQGSFSNWQLSEKSSARTGISIPTSQSQLNSNFPIAIIPTRRGYVS